MITADEMITSLEVGTDQPLTEEEKYEVQQYHNGRLLSQLIMMPGWEVLLEAFKQHKEDAVEELLRINPSDTDAVLAAQAVAYGIHQTLDNLIYEVNDSIQKSRQLPAILSEKLEAQRLIQN